MVQTNSNQGSWKHIADTLRRDIESGVYRDGDRLASESELMKEFGASKATVHRALRELSNEGHVKRVERLGTFVTKGRKKSNTRRLGLILRTSENFFEYKMIAGLREQFTPTDQFLLYDTGNDPVAEFEAVERAEDECDGLFIVPTCNTITSRKLQEMSSNGFPVVCLDRYPVSTRLPAVTTNNYTISKQVLDQFVSEGHRNIAYYGIHNDEQSTLYERLRAYRDCCIHTIGGSPDLYVRLIPPRTGEHLRLSLSLIEDSLLRLLSHDQPISLAFCANEFYLEAVTEVCKALPRHLSDRLEIVSFAESPRVRYSGHRVHLIRQDELGIGREAGKMMQSLFDKTAVGIPRVEVPATFIHADSETDDRASNSFFVSLPRVSSERNDQNPRA